MDFQIHLDDVSKRETLSKMQLSIDLHKYFKMDFQIYLKEVFPNGYS